MKMNDEYVITAKQKKWSTVRRRERKFLHK